MSPLPKVFIGSIAAFSIAHTVAAGVQYAGVNIAGFDFGCTPDGTCNVDNIVVPEDGPDQMSHFTKDDGLNLFRLPVAWQYLVNNKLGGTLDETNFGTYDKLMQGCLVTGARCVIDIHNYARWNGKIIGTSGGPTVEDFASLWEQLATKYASDDRVGMGLINEPHDLSPTELNIWVDAVQAAVTAIRGAGASEHMILIPGNGYTGAHNFVSDGSAAALSKVANPDGSTKNLIFDVHQYFDEDNSGTHTGCVSNKISEAFEPLRDWLKTANRQALVTEMGGGSSNPTCLTNICDALDYLNENSDYYLGWAGWAAGAFSTDYILGLRPTGNQDVPLLTTCFAGKFDGSAANSSAPEPQPSPPGTAMSSPAAALPTNSTPTHSSVPTTLLTYTSNPAASPSGMGSAYPVPGQSGSTGNNSASMPGTAPGYTGPPLSPASGGYRGGLKAGVQHSSNNTVPLESTPTTTGLGNSSSGTAVGAGEGEAEEDECEDED